jgi:purine-binding chemotaxis protein CheW
MSENERMERAKRIRRMREGQRDGEDDSPETDDDADTEPAADGTETADEVTQSEPAPADPNESTEESATTSTDGGATAAPAEPEGDRSEDGADGAEEAEEDVDAAVENVSGTRAELPSTEQMEAAMEQTMEQAEQVTDEDEAATEDAETEADADAEADAETEESAGPAAGIAGDAEQTKEADTRILEFTLDDEQYCLDIQYIEEIVKHTAITRVPNTPEFVEGVVDLRGQITTILNPKVTIDKPNKEAGDLIVVFDSEAFEDQGHIGWVVDDVRQVSPISEDDVNDPPMQEDYINGVIDRDDGEFVIWTTPDLALEEAD